MYDETLEGLKKDLQNLQGKTLAALGDGKTELYHSLKEQELSLKQKVEQREQEVSEAASQQRTSRQNQVKKNKETRLEFSRSGFEKLELLDKKVSVYNGHKDDQDYSYADLLKKMNAILAVEKKFTIGNQYDGLLSAIRNKEGTLFSYSFSNRNENSFELEVVDTENLDTFLKTVTLLSSSSEPEIEHGIGQSLTEAHYQYPASQIIHDLFDAFAKGLYKKKD